MADHGSRGTILDFFSPSASDSPVSERSNDDNKISLPSDDTAAATVCTADSEDEDVTPTNTPEVSISATSAVVSGEVRLNPHQPKLSMFPSKRFGNHTRSFQSCWFEKWKWLDWDEDRSCVFCHSCRMAVLLQFKLSKRSEATFSISGFSNWKDATRSFRKHEASIIHKEATLKWVHYSKSQSVAVQISQQLLRDQVHAQKCLLKIISTLQYLARQGLAIRGHIENEGNFLQLLQLRCEDSQELRTWLERRNSWLSHDVQNELLEIMGHMVLTSILADIKQNKYYTIILDEATDVSFKEQVSICIRHVSANTLEVCEDFTGLYETENTTSETLTILVKDAMCRYSLSLSDCRGQAYDGAANLSGRLSGVQARISREYPKALYNTLFLSFPQFSCSRCFS